MRLKAGIEKSTVYSKEIRYRQQIPPKVGSEAAEYDACYYEITMDKSILSDYVPEKLNLKVTSKSGSINAYVYGGKSRS